MLQRAPPSQTPMLRPPVGNCLWHLCPLGRGEHQRELVGTNSAENNPTFTDGDFGQSDGISCPSRPWPYPRVTVHRGSPLPQSPNPKRPGSLGTLTADQGHPILLMKRSFQSLSSAPNLPTVRFSIFPFLRVQLPYFSRKGFSGLGRYLAFHDPAEAKTPIPLGLNRALWEPRSRFLHPQLLLLTTAGRASNAACAHCPHHPRCSLALSWTGGWRLEPGSQDTRCTQHWSVSPQAHPLPQAAICSVFHHGTSTSLSS